MSLLTPTEAHAFQSFLTALDTTDFSPEWNMQLEISHEHMPPARGREALAKATKDLMSLDADRWKYPLGPQSPRETLASPVNRQLQADSHPFSFLYSTRQNQSPDTETNGSTPPNQLPSHSQRPSSRSRKHAPPLRRSVDSTSVSAGTRAKASAHGHGSHSSSRISPVDIPTSISSSSSNGISTPVSSSSKRPSPPEPLPSSKRQRATPSSSRQNSAIDILPKTALLSPSQKKANHIQSEQKRRANIRRGYEALCETVPSLREAIHAEEGESLENGKGKGRRKGKAKASADDGEKVDGRSGPRSENVVLAKTIDYINELLLEREAFLQRLRGARSVLPDGHPLLSQDPDAPPPLWERKWTGGEHKDEDEDEDEDD
ncbi:hypothetical protein BJ138DRAFT_1062624 [Hygrophoropsis aurantiaca]|uniref:Uncharacterized protein n=1 Tax=Hygrophoropsis aurantiaca TaxID=72124 RepID=A0ACB8AEE2_9AGAM|nr:hypothetical protein BJ138DRAFT_1062624 [Hygrophoropsis aurantiaca]